MKCHYEVLELGREADDAAIKTAYRKLALRWHPDKNLENSEEAKTKFQVIQQAYEVLSDPQERAWYDRHREQILRGSDSYEDESLDVFQYFTVTCYRGYDESAGAFYAVYRDVFERLAAEDLEFMDSDDESTDIPSFGRADSDYEQVVGPFYAYWSSYCTRKSYAWLCQHNVTEIRDRRILRHVEKDTKKLAQKARKERNDEVRALVAFVKKRDRRVLEYRRLLEDRAEQNRLKQQEKRLEQLRRNRAEVEEQMRLQKEAGVGQLGDDYEAQLRKMEAAYGRDSDEETDDEGDDEDEDEEAEEGELDDVSERFESVAALGGDGDEDEEVYIDHLYCVACNKAFKNESSMQNHESSKKHKDNIEKLRVEMMDDEDAHNGATSDSTASGEVDEEPEDVAEDGETIVIEANNDAEELEETAQPVASKLSKKARRKMQKVIATPPTSEDEQDTAAAASQTDVNGVAAAVSEDDDDDQPKRQTKKSKRKAKKAAAAEAPAKPTANTSKSTKKHPASSGESDGDDADDWDQRRGSRKANTKAARKAAKKAVSVVDLDEEVDIDHTCVTCAAVFESKNKLFAHLKKMNHGVYIEGKGVTASRAAAAEAAATAATQTRGKGRKK